MSDASNDSISIDDLFAAFGTSPEPAKAKKGGSSPKKNKDATKHAPTTPTPSTDKKAADQDESDVVSVMAALGIMPPRSMQTTATHHEERAKRVSEREEQIREQQIRSQQWRRELEEQQARRRAQEEAAKEEPVQPQAEPAQTRKPFAQDDTQIAEPSFLEKRDAARTEPLAEPKPEFRGGFSEVAPAAAAAMAPVEQNAAAMAEQPSPTASPAETGGAPAVSGNAPSTAQVESVRAKSGAQADVLPDEQPTMPLEETHAGQSAPAPSSVIKPISESAAAQMQTSEADIPSSETAAQNTQVIKPLETATQTAAAADAGEQMIEQPTAAETAAPAAPTLERSIVSGEPRPSLEKAAAQKKAPKATEAPKEKHHVNKGNVVGIILIIIAVLCATLTVLLLTGTIDATTFSSVTSPASSSSEQAQESSSSSTSDASSAQEQGTMSHAVYQYVVRGTDGGTYQATETATFGADGLLDQSSIVIQVPNPDQAQGLLDQLKADFGDSVVESGVRDGEVYLTIDINRDDLNVDSYTELLSSNMAEFRLVETGVTEV